MISTFLYQIEQYLKSELSELGLEIKATPKQKFINDGFELLDAKGSILINGELDEFNEMSKVLEFSNIQKGISRLIYRIEISVGIKEYNETFNLNDIIDTVFDKIAYCYNNEFSPLVPGVPNPVIVDGNSVQWKTLSFTTSKTFRKSPSTTEIQED